MLTLKSQTRRDLLNEIAEYLRYRALEEGLPAHPTFRKRAAVRLSAMERENALRQVAREIEHAVITAN